MSKLREQLHGTEIVVAPGIYDAFGALMVERAGFPAAYLSGASITDTLRQQPTDNVNIMTHDPISINVVEGATFGYYTIKLDTQPRKVQR